MIDTLTVRAAIGRPHERHQTALAQVSIARFSASKSKPTTTFIKSPLTGAQVEVKYWIETVTIPTAMLEVRLPLASATMGQNYLHTGLTSIKWEILCAALLIKIILTVLRFEADEIKRFMDDAVTVELELTWHAKTASPRAQKNLLNRTARWFEQLKTISGYHDIAVQDVDYRRKNGAPGLLVEFKGGDKFRQYGKFDQTAALSKKGKHKYALSSAMKALEPEVLQVIESHARNEVLIGGATMKSLSLLHPGSWDEATLRKALNAGWAQTGLVASPKAQTAGASAKILSAEVASTLRRYRARDLTLKKGMSAATFGRHRKAIAEFDGTDIAYPPNKKVMRPSSLRQLAYDRRWEPSGPLRQLALCEATGPAIVEELKRGLAFIEDGVLRTGVVPDEAEAN